METQKFELIKDAIGYSIPNTAKGKLYKNPENVYSSRTTKLDGRIVFIRTSDGFKKMIQTTVPSNYKYFYFDTVKLVPSATYNQAGNLAVTTNPTTPPPSSFDGVANTGMLDDSFSNIKGRIGKYYPVNEFQNQVSNAFAYRYLPTQTAINGAVPRHNLPNSVISNENRLNDLKIHRNVPHEFVTHRTIVNFDGEIVSNAIGEAEAKQLADNNKVIYTEAEAKKLYASSGSDKPFKEWLKSDNARKFLTDLADIGATLILASGKGGSTGFGTGSTGTGYVPPSDDKDDKGGATILGMHPVTFTVVSVVVLVGGFFGVRYLVKRGKGK